MEKEFFFSRKLAFFRKEFEHNVAELLALFWKIFQTGKKWFELPGVLLDSKLY